VLTPPIDHLEASPRERGEEHFECDEFEER
jgi:hypothetical protein